MPEKPRPPQPGPPSHAAARDLAGSKTVRRARQIATVFDDYFVDPALGLLAPGVGDALSALFGLYVVVLGFRERLAPVTLARMLINLAVDALVGVVPILGDLFDFTYRAHTRNLALLESRHVTRQSRPSDWLFVVGAAVLVLAALSLPVALAVYLLLELF